MSYVKGIQNACCAGICASFSSVLGKLTFTSEIDKNPMFILVPTISNAIPFISPDNAFLGLRVLSMVLNIVLTVFMMGFFAQSLQHMSTLTATVLNVSANFIFTAFCGWLIFSETLTLQWFIGANFIMVGVFLIIRGESTDTQKRSTKSDKTE
jgi:drug/metabolite transporter (DMT)-like permease